MEQQLATVDPRDQLTAREKKALEKWERSKDKAVLALDLALAMYELFLNGHSLEEIQRVNKKQGKDFDLGLLAGTAMKYQWHERRRVHLDSLFDGIRLKTQQAQTEAVSFLTDVLAVAHREHGDKLKTFLQTGDASVFGTKNIRVDSLHDYRTIIGLLLQVTGQDRAPNSGGGGTQVNVITGGAAASVKTVDGKLKGDDAAKLLELIGGEQA